MSTRSANKTVMGDDDPDENSRNKKKSNTNGAKPKKGKTNVKNEEITGDFDEPNPKKQQSESSNKTPKRKKNVKEEEDVKPNGGDQIGKKREKKVYSLPGQKRDPPDERDPLRIFYESLYKQIPTSEMAAFWMMESGLLPVEEANKVYEKKLQMKQQQKLDSPMKAVVSVKNESSSVKRNINSSDQKTTKGASKSSKKGDVGNNQTDNDSGDDFVSPVSKGKKSRAA